MLYKKLALIAAFSLILTGCGKDDNADEISSSSDVVVTAAEEPTELSTTTAETSEAETTEAVTEEEATTEPVAETEPASSADSTNAMTDDLSSENKGVDLSCVDSLGLGMSEDEVFSLLGQNFDNMTEKSLRPSIEYQYIASDHSYGTDLRGYVFVEFNTDKELVCFGFHLGPVGNINEPVYPYSEEQLKNGYDQLLELIKLNNGEPTNTDNEYVEYGIKAQNTWDTDEGQLWAVYGINMWASDAPESYEKGINEIVVSYSVK